MKTFFSTLSILASCILSTSIVSGISESNSNLRGHSDNQRSLQVDDEVVECPCFDVQILQEEIPTDEELRLCDLNTRRNVARIQLASQASFLAEASAGSCSFNGATSSNSDILSSGAESDACLLEIGTFCNLREGIAEPPTLPPIIAPHDLTDDPVNVQLCLQEPDRPEGQNNYFWEFRLDDPTDGPIVQAGNGFRDMIGAGERCDHFVFQGGRTYHFLLRNTPPVPEQTLIVSPISARFAFSNGFTIFDVTVLDGTVTDMFVL